VAKGETLASIVKQQNLSPGLLHQIVNSSKTAKALARINPGQELRFAYDGNGQLQQLVLQRNPVSSLEVHSTPDGFQAQETSRPVETRYSATTGIIESSLFVDGHKAGLSDTQIMELAQIFGWDIDFALELREGDQFHVIYEEQYLDGKKYKNGPIVAAEFVNRGNVYKAVRYTDKHGDTAYYDMDGSAKRRAFIRTPVKFSRISSRFTRKRWHPVLKRWRSHKGVDYAAPKGTPVKATGNGKVVFRGKKGGYGNVIFLRHGGKYTTVYGHLSRFAKGLHRGQSVKQGQIIGYVGSTGLATGPHLHYEFRVHGKHQNPLTIKLPKSIRLPKSELARFRKITSPLLAQLDELRAKTMVASAR
jgi:murein DD-endopeptidase MepM/ murein hydrolase activator NlpD